MLAPCSPLLAPSRRRAAPVLVGAFAACLAVLSAPAARAACDPGMPFRTVLICFAQESNEQAAAIAALETSLAAAQTELATTRAELVSTQAELAWTSAEADAQRAEVDGLLAAGLATQAWVQA